MNELRAIKYFIALSNLGSFTRVADEFQVTKSLISKEISKLESKLGAKLLQRSTRNILLTEIGHGYLKHAREIILKYDDADSFVQDAQGHPKGQLKINASFTIGYTVLQDAFAAFMSSYPDISLEVHFSDESIDLIAQGFDVGIRGASQNFESNYIGTVLKKYPYHVCVSADYFDHHPKIIHPNDLKDHNCFVYSYFRNKNVWPLLDGIAVKGSLKMNNSLMLINAVKKGLGVGFVPEFSCQQALQNGEVISILNEFIQAEVAVYALYPAREFVPPKIKLFISFLQDWFKVDRGH